MKKRGSVAATAGAVMATVVSVVVVIPLLAMGAGDFEPPADPCAGPGPGAGGSPIILGPSTLTSSELMDWWTSTGHAQPDALGLPVEDVLAMYLAEAEAEGVRGDLAVAQAVYETGWFTNADTARNNFAGIRHYDGAASGDAFPDVATGVRAHVQLLKKYAAGNNVTLARPDVSPETGARATTWEELAGTWATSPDYWSGISDLYDTMLDETGHEEAPGMETRGACGPTNADVVAAFEGSPGNVPLTIVEDITVHSEIAPQVAALIAAARADGHTLTGSGYRSPERQIELRRAHCGRTDYAIYEMPSSQCSPPTARPGASNHELGLAIDFDCNDTLIGSRSSACFTWLAANAPTFGLYNLPSEPWHWSVDGT